MSRFFYTGAFRFPNKDAAAARVIGNAKVLRKLGYEVIFLGWEESAVNKVIYEGFTGFPQNEFSSEKRGILRRLFDFIILGNKTLSYIKKNAKPGDSIIAYHGGTWFLLQLWLYCKVKNIHLYFDCTEWYDYNHLVGGLFGPVNLDFQIRMRLVYKFFITRGIVISFFLKDIFKKSIVVPPLIDLTADKWNFPISQRSHNFDDEINLVYAGNPGSKDKLDQILQAITTFNESNHIKRIYLHFFGVERAVLQNLVSIEIFNNSCQFLIFNDRINQEEVPKKLSSYDFLIFLRPAKKYAMAGFPTKFVESFGAGCPVITNYTSDLNLYLKNSFNGFVIDELNVESILEVFNKVVLLSWDDLYEMKKNAYQTAKMKFDYINFENHFKQLLEQ
ncbi:glycosyltransferase [Acinetobacter pittii]|uniref:glycosyltransferase n=1 Tax=Acinetobacter pittii TaxID=48296 RepID=UPI0021CD2495|nr:glycosyltransferase [Acinetobacter pittii]MCU4550033.1 glycosyltransferase [Acinetobacter pittii]